MGFDDVNRNGRIYPKETLLKAIDEMNKKEVPYIVNLSNDNSSFPDFANEIDDQLAKFNEKGYKLFYHDNHFYVEGIDEIPAEATLIQDPKIIIKEFADDSILIKMEITGIGISKNSKNDICCKRSTTIP